MHSDIPSEFVEFPWLVIKHSQYSVQELAHFWVHLHFFKNPVVHCTSLSITPELLTLKGWMVINSIERIKDGLGPSPQNHWL